MIREILLLESAVAAPTRVLEVALHVQERGEEVRSTFALDGGIARKEIVRAIDSTLVSEGFRPGSRARFGTHEIDYVADNLHAAVSVQAGRAMTNNGALLSVLAVASSPAIDWLILLLPNRYKSSNTFASTVAQLQALRDAPGIELEIKGAVLLGY